MSDNKKEQDSKECSPETDKIIQELQKCSLQDLKRMVNQRSRDGNTPLHWAVMQASPDKEMIKLFLFKLQAHPYVANDKGLYPVDLIHQNTHLNEEDKTYYET